jgi:sirohydrochlorin cobaltochelatase
VNVLIIAAHGSRKKESALEVAALVQNLESMAHPGFDRVVHGFLQFSNPLLPGVIDEAVADGANRIVVFPFFISAGSHILTDIPELIAGYEKQHPEVDFVITRHLGVAEGIPDVILNTVDEHVDSGAEG